jgi:hypothetical protein
MRLFRLTKSIAELRSSAVTSEEPWGLTGGMARVGVIGTDMVAVSCLVRNDAMWGGERARRKL